MRLFLLIISFLFLASSANARSDCGHSNWIWEWSNDQQACNRCRFAGGELRNNCAADNVSQPGGKNTATVVRLDAVNSSQFSEPQYIIKMRYGYCDGGSWTDPWHSDGCDGGGTANSGWVEVEETMIVSKPDQCQFNLQQFSKTNQNNPIVTNLKNKVCLVKFRRENVNNYASDFPLSSTDDFPNVVCAFDVTAGGRSMRGDISQWTSIGCIPYPMVDGPPPFSNGFVPASYFVVPKVGLVSQLYPDTKFQEPIGVLNLVVGSDILDTMTLDIKLESGQNQICQQYKGSGPQYCASVDDTTPDKINIMKGNMPLGSYPRPAIEQKKGNLSFFPCYHTYVDFKNNAYQAIFPFSINANMGDKIGKTSDGKDLYLGLNYLPSTSPSKIGDIRETKCDLCINAAKQSSWDDNIYSNGYIGFDGSNVTECTLDSNLVINKITVLGNNRMEITYPFDSGGCKDSQIPAPLRVDMFDTDEQAQSNSCNQKSPDLLDYSYVSPTGFLENYLVGIKAVIPKLKDDGEADYYTAVQAPPNPKKHCNTYLEDPDGMVFIIPAGQRDTTSCKDDPSKPNASFALCSGVGPNKIYDAICPGLYQGTTQDQAFPDKICMMSSEDWDFFSGRYDSKNFSSLNGNNIVVPRMSCTHMPFCKSLGPNTIPNIGQAIWDTDIKLNDQTNGKCEFEYDSQNKPTGNYSYRYVISDYQIDGSAKSDQDYDPLFEQELEQIKTQNSKSNYISVAMLSNKFQAFYKNAMSKGTNVFTCTKIPPQAQCIGGIFGNVTQDTSCVNVSATSIPIKCK